MHAACSCAALLTFNRLQAQVDRAPKFIKVVESFREFLIRNGLIDRDTGERLERYVWYVISSHMYFTQIVTNMWHALRIQGVPMALLTSGISSSSNASSQR